MDAFNSFCFRLKDFLSRRSLGGRIFIAVVGLLLFGALVGQAADRYVVEPGTIADGHGGVYTDWTIAATQIQWAVDAAIDAGDTVWVSNGVYVLTNQILIASPITLRSANGPDVTAIDGGYVPGSATTNNRCIYMNNTAAFVHGFTISNGALIDAYGVGVYVKNAGVLSNCYVTANTLFGFIGNAYGCGIMAINGGTVTACRVFGNLITNVVPGGGGAGIYSSTEVSHCVISNNNMYGSFNDGNNGAGINFVGGRIRSSVICNNNCPAGFAGGVFLQNTIMDDCTVANNSAAYVGGIYCYNADTTITNCVVSNNTSSGYGGGIYLRLGGTHYVDNTTIVGNSPGVQMNPNASGACTLRNCVIKNGAGGVAMGGSENNSLINCTVQGTIGIGVDCYGGIIRNCLITGSSSNGLFIESTCLTGLVSACTIVSNMSAGAGAGIRIEATAPNVLSISSCIIYSNGVAGNDDVYDAASPANIGALQYSCVGANPGFTGAGIIVANPQFKDFAGGNYRLAGNSPCINAGSNETWMTNSVDLDGNVRIRYGRVDMGAYELLHRGTILTGH